MAGIAGHMRYAMLSGFLAMPGPPLPHAWLPRSGGASGITCVCRSRRCMLPLSDLACWMSGSTSTRCVTLPACSEHGMCCCCTWRVVVLRYCSPRMRMPSHIKQLHHPVCPFLLPRNRASSATHCRRGGLRTRAPSLSCAWTEVRGVGRNTKHTHNGCARGQHLAPDGTAHHLTATHSGCLRRHVREHHG